MQKWVITQAKLRDVPGGRPGSKVLCEIPAFAVVEPTGTETTTTFNGEPTDWVEVTYTSASRTWRGWTYEGFLADLENESDPVVAIETPTPNPNDAAQYAIWLGNVQYNLCGELAVAYCINASLKVLLETWQAKVPSVYNYIFYGGKGKTTSLTDLDGILHAFDVSTPTTRLDRVLYDKVLQRSLVTPQRLEGVLLANRIIVGCRIETALGRLRASGVPHWVVVESVYPYGINNAATYLYNPYTNVMEAYTWSELLASTGPIPQGILVPRL